MFAIFLLSTTLKSAHTWIRDITSLLAVLFPFFCLTKCQYLVYSFHVLQINQWSGSMDIFFFLSFFLSVSVFLFWPKYQHRKHASNVICIALLDALLMALHEQKKTNDSRTFFQWNGTFFRVNCDTKNHSKNDIHSLVDVHLNIFNGIKHHQKSTTSKEQTIVYWQTTALLSVSLASGNELSFSLFIQLTFTFLLFFPSHSFLSVLASSYFSPSSFRYWFAF